MKLNKLYLLIAAGAIYFGYSKLVNIKDGLHYSFKKTRVAWKEADASQVPVYVTYLFKNTNNEPLVINWFVGKLFYGRDYYLSKITLPEVKIAENEEVEVQVKYSINPLLVVGELMDAIKNKRWLQKFYVRDGELNFNVFGSSRTVKIDNYQIEITE
jgi:hypothetical protein